MSVMKGIKNSSAKYTGFLRSFSKGFRFRFSNINMPEYVTYSVFAILTGAFAGLGAVFFHECIEITTEFSFNHLVNLFGIFGVIGVIFVPALGMLIQSIMISAFPKTASKKGITEVIKSVAVRGGYIPFRTTLFHFIAPIICIGTGGTMGPEGPAAQLGGGVGSKLGNLFGLSDSRRRMFTAAGAGAAISAVFNTPLGGIFFGLEIILLNDFHSPTFSALILSSVTASAISRIFLGNTPAFIFDTVSIGSYNQLYYYALLGLLAGLLSLLFVKYSDSMKQFISHKIKPHLPGWSIMVIVGLLVGISGFFYSDVFGIGYGAINSILSNSMPLKIALILLALKFILVPLILHSGGFGGIFAPSLFMGACFGFIFATGLNQIWGLNLDTTTYTLVGMGAVLGGINSIPISSIMIIFEMTKDYTFILPLMLAVVISTMMVQLIMKGSAHVKHLEREGFNISQGREVSILRSILVSDVMKDDILLIPESTPLRNLISQLIESPHGTFYTMNDDGEISGKITENELRPIITEYESLREMLLVGDIAIQDFEVVYDSDDLDSVLRLFGKQNVDVFPVISTKEPGKVIGTVIRQDVITAYNQESLKTNLADGFATELKSIKKDKIAKVAEGYSIIERIVPQKYVGKTLNDIRFRNIYDLDILMIKKRKESFDLEDNDSEVIMPKPDYKLVADDVLVLFGSDQKIEKTEEWHK